MSKICITIGREFGSGGREVGKKLAQLLNIKYFDKEILELASNASGVDKSLFENSDEKRNITFSEGIFAGQGAFMGNFYTFNDTLSSDNLFMHKVEAIKQIADEGDCIIVGRCADYVLRDRENVISVFIHCNNAEVKHNRVKERHPEIEEKNIDAFIHKTDKKRASYYNYYTDRNWGDFRHYDVTIDTSKFGVDGTAELLAKAVKEHT